MTDSHSGDRWHPLLHPHDEHGKRRAARRVRPDFLPWTAFARSFLTAASISKS